MTYEAKHPQPPTADKHAAIGKFAEEMTRAGILVDTGAMFAVSSTVSLDDGKFAAADTPAPPMPMIGYAIVRVKSQAEAVEVARRFMTIAGDGKSEIRQLTGPAD